MLEAKVFVSDKTIMGYLLFMSIQIYIDIEWGIEVFQHRMLCIFL